MFNWCGAKFLLTREEQNFQWYFTERARYSEKWPYLYQKWFYSGSFLLKIGGILELLWKLVQGLSCDCQSWTYRAGGIRLDLTYYYQGRRKVWKSGGASIIWWAQSAPPGWDRVHWSAKIFGCHGNPDTPGDNRPVIHI